MCDYSLMGLSNRLAVAGETLVTRRFAAHGMSGVVGLAPVPASGQSSFAQRLTGQAKPQVQCVCLPPGAKLLIEDMPAAMRKKFDVSKVEEVVFDQANVDSSYNFRDGIRFANGRRVSLQEVPVGLMFQVLSLESSEQTSAIAERKEEVAIA